MCGVASDGALLLDLRYIASCIGCGIVGGVLSHMGELPCVVQIRRRRFSLSFGPAAVGVERRAS